MHRWRINSVGDISDEGAVSQRSTATQDVINVTEMSCRSRIKTAGRADARFMHGPMMGSKTSVL
jgi:hypothetical protein